MFGICANVGAGWGAGAFTRGYSGTGAGAFNQESVLRKDVLNDGVDHGAEVELFGVVDESHLDKLKKEHANIENEIVKARCEDYMWATQKNACFRNVNFYRSEVERILREIKHEERRLKMAELGIK